MSNNEGITIAVLYSSGGLGDVGRHVVQAALEKHPSQIACIKIITNCSPSTLLEQNRWNCGCPQGHALTEEDKKRIEVIHADITRNDADTLLQQQLHNVSAVISCLGNRQPFWGDLVGKEGTEHLVKAMARHGIRRLVVMSSVGIDDDWPPVEWSWVGSIMAGLFTTVCRANYQDLAGVEHVVRDASHYDNLDYLIVRPLGLGEDVTPEGHWYLQKTKGEDIVGINMAKLDCARFMLQEVLTPEHHCTAVVVGGKPAECSREKQQRHKFSLGVGQWKIPLSSS